MITLTMLGRRCRTARMAMGFDDAADFAALIDMPAPRYVGIEAGAIEPTLAEIVTIAQFTARSIDLLVSGRSSAPVGG